MLTAPASPDAGAKVTPVVSDPSDQWVQVRAILRA